MPRATFAQMNFNGGEWSPLTAGRADIQKYRTALALCKNWLPMQQGGLTRRPGTKYVTATKYQPVDATPPVKFVRFEFSLDQAYVLEFGSSYIRFYTQGSQLQTGSVTAYNGATAYTPGDIVSSGGTNYICISAVTGTAPPNTTYWYALTGTILEIPTPWIGSVVNELSVAQTADVMYIVHPNYPPYKLQRFGATKWALTKVAFFDGPYGDLNTTPTTLTPSGSSGTITVTASGTEGINGGVGFQASDVGRSIRLRYNSDSTTSQGSLFSLNLGRTTTDPIYTWLWGTITSVTSSTVVQVAVQEIDGSTAPVQATAVATVSAGVVVGINLTNPGVGYKNQQPRVQVVPHNSTPAAITATVSSLGTITGLTLVSGGGGYTASANLPIVFGSSTSYNFGTGASGYATTDAAGVVTSVTLQYGGFGYFTTASVTCTVVDPGSASGTGAAATATVGDDGTISSIKLTAGGTGYTGGADVIIDPPAARIAKATSVWRLGLWNSVDGYPSCVGFHQGRLCLAGTPNYPNRVDASNTGDYENFGPTQYDGTVVDSNAFSFTLNSGQQDAVEWLVTDENGLLIGTTGNEWLIAPSSTQQAITPTNVNSKPMSNYGSVGLPAVRLGKSAMFVQRDGRKLRELFYQFTFNTFQATDLSLVSEHLTESGVKQFDVQFSPQQIFWIVRNDGKLVSLVYDRDQEVSGWEQHELGGYLDAGHTQPAFVESVCVVPRPDLLRDEVWVCVQRYINGAVYRSVEVMNKPWQNGDLVKDAVFLDSCATFSKSGTNVYPGTGTLMTLVFRDSSGIAVRHGFQTGDTTTINFSNPFSAYSGTYVVTVVDDSTITVATGAIGGGAETGTFTASPSTTLHGLTWLEGETLGVLADGAVAPDVTVDGTGAVVLANPASVVQVGYRYTSQAKTMKIEAGGADGPDQGKLKRIHRVIFRFFQSVLLEIGSDDPSTGGFYSEPWRDSEDPMGSGLTPYTGDFRWSYEGDWGPDAQVSWRTTEPLPCNILMVSVQMDTEDNL